MSFLFSLFFLFRCFIFLTAKKIPFATQKNVSFEAPPSFIPRIFFQDGSQPTRPNTAGQNGDGGPE